MAAFIDIVLFRINFKFNRSSGSGFELIPDMSQVSGYQGKQITGFFKGVLPSDKMPVPIKIAMLNKIAVGKKSRIFSLIGNNGAGIYRHHIRAIRKRRNLSKSL